MQVDEGGPARGERPAVGHADRGRLLKAEHVANVRRVDERVHERHLGRAGIAEDVGDALIAQDVDENVARASGHRGFPSGFSRILHDLTETRHCDPRDQVRGEAHQENGRALPRVDCFAAYAG